MKYIATINQAVLSLHQIAFKTIQKHFFPKMKTLFDQIVLKQLKTSKRQMLQKPFDIGSIQHVYGENTRPIRYVFWFDSVWIWYNKNAA